MAFRNVNISKVLTIALLILTTPMSDAFMANGGFYRKKSNLGAFTSVQLAKSFFFSGLDASANRQFWISDGTSIGTRILSFPTALFATAQAPSPYFALIGTNLVFSGATPASGTGLFITDGSSVGTRQIVPTGANAFASAGLITSIHSLGTNKVMLVANDSSGTARLYVSDGTSSGTAIVAPSNLMGGMTSLVSWRGLIYFQARDQAGNYNLWQSDGTVNGTVTFTSPLWLANGTLIITSGPFVVNGKLTVSAYDTSGRNQIFTSADGVNITELIPNTAASVLNAINFQGCNGKMFFNASDAGVNKLWVSDGTAANTVAMALPSSGTPGIMGMRNAVCVGTNLFFYGNTTASSQYRAIYRTDGVSAITQFLPTGYVIGSQNGIFLASFSGKLSFTASTTSPSSYSAAFWVSTDGTSANTSVVTPTGFSFPSLGAIGQWVPGTP